MSDKHKYYQYLNHKFKKANKCYDFMKMNRTKILSSNGEIVIAAVTDRSFNMIP